LPDCFFDRKNMKSVVLKTTESLSDGGHFTLLSNAKDSGPYTLKTFCESAVRIPDTYHFGFNASDFICAARSYDALQLSKRQRSRGEASKEVCSFLFLFRSHF
jgi:hypothetical protein